ncbi:unnamed protein product [Lactuca virosa]|uniref:Reverse transcriptase zinc-binding domain-containing protein n=1 Tax=Lactuca virosa TaxID=75947 RepID=A0AAU9MKH3_9ASTR|nr:unnamed protein product [Lactuca virosa]
MSRVWNNIADIKRAIDKVSIPHDKIIKKHQGAHGISWKCDLMGNRRYQVNALHHVLEDKGATDNGRFNWIKEVPSKVTCFIWRAKMGRIPTTVALAKRRINLQSTTCCLCNSTEECSDHVLVQCPFAKTIME